MKTGVLDWLVQARAPSRIAARKLSASTSRTRIERAFVADEVRRLKASSERDLVVGGPHLAAQMIAANLVDELHAFVSPIILGGGKAWLPRDLRIPLELAGERRRGRVVHLHYEQPPPSSTS